MRGVLLGSLGLGLYISALGCGGLLVKAETEPDVVPDPVHRDPKPVRMSRRQALERAATAGDAGATTDRREATSTAGKSEPTVRPKAAATRSTSTRAKTSSSAAPVAPSGPASVHLEVAGKAQVDCRGKVSERFEGSVDFTIAEEDLPLQCLVRAGSSMGVFMIRGSGTTVCSGSEMACSPEVVGL